MIGICKRMMLGAVQDSQGAGPLPPAPSALFEPDNLEPDAQEVVTLNDLSSNTPTAWSWTITGGAYTFVNGTTANSQHPQVTFDESGLYSISLEASNAGGSDTYQETDLITSWVDTKSLEFDGVDEGVELAPFIPYIGGDEQGTFSCWVKPHDSSGTRTFTSFGGPGASNIVSFHQENLKIKAYLWDNGVRHWQVVTLADVLTVNQWHHVALVHDGVEPKIYVNGVNQGDWHRASLGPAWIKDIALVLWGYIGIHWAGFPTGYFDGLMAEWIYYQTALSAAQISDLYNSGSPPNPKKLDSWPDHAYYLRAENADNYDNFGMYDQGDNAEVVGSLNMEAADQKTDTP